jgi:hypothetical protein
MDTEEETRKHLQVKLLELETEWEGRLHMDDLHYMYWLPSFVEKVAQERGGYYGLLFTYCDADEENDPDNGKYRCLYPLHPIPHGGVALITRNVETLEREVKKFLKQMRIARF